MPLGLDEVLDVLVEFLEVHFVLGFEGDVADVDVFGLDFGEEEVAVGVGGGSCKVKPEFHKGPFLLFAYVLNDLNLKRNIFPLNRQK